MENLSKVILNDYVESPSKVFLNNDRDGFAKQSALRD